MNLFSFSMKSEDGILSYLQLLALNRWFFFLLRRPSGASSEKGSTTTNEIFGGHSSNIIRKGCYMCHDLGSSKSIYVYGLDIKARKAPN